MQFKYHLPETNPQLALEKCGWTKLPTMANEITEEFKHSALIGIGIALLLIVIAPSHVSLTPILDDIGYSMGLFVSTLIVHELIHGVMLPKFGLSSNSIYGISLKHVCVYVHWTSSISMLRYLLVLFAPFAVLSIGLFIASHLVVDKSMATIIIYIAIVNASSSGMDLLNIYKLLNKVDIKSQLHFNGLLTYYK